MFGGKRQITFNGQTHIATDGAKLRDADIAELRKSETEVAQAEGNVRFLGIDLADKPGVIEAVKAEFAASFEAISVLWKEKLY
jgi:hypothetical protein